MAFTALSDAVQLPIAVAPLNGDILENAEWDFSHCRLVDDGARTSVRVYGDSLMSEIFDGRRFWYALGDSVYFMGEEDRLTSIIFVIQPQDRGNVMKTKCFRYSYNSRGNCIMKAVPGGAVTRYCYDSRNRLFAEQDGNMKDSAQWLIHHYDYLGRPAFNAFAKVSDAVVQALSTKSFTVISPVTSADMRTHTGGYVCPTELTSKVTYIGLDAAHYYDSYDFASGFPAGWDWSNSPNGFATPRTSVLGLETAMAAGRHILLKMYDNEGRIIREVFGEMLQVPEREVLTRYNYQGQIAEQLETTYSPQTVCRSTVNTYSNTGHLLSTKVSQDGKTAILKRQYDGAGRLSNLCMGGITDCSYSYNANGWLTLSTTKTKRIVPVNPLSLEPVIELPQSGLSIPSDTVITERLYYADSTYSISPRYDGKISARKRDRMITVYDYDNHGRLASSHSIPTARLAIAQLPDFATTYTYDRNANITSLIRQGIIDRTVLQMTEYGLHSSYTMSYNGNRLCSMHVDREGEDYEGRTGPGVTGYISDFWHDSNGNLCRDSSRGIVLIKYNRHNLPADIYFENGHRQTINYDGFGQKRSIVYKQTSEPILGSAGTIIDVPTDSNYTIEGRRDYIGSHVFVNDSLEYSAFPGGYFAPEGTFYYVTDWQGNNAAVLKSDGTLVQQTTYYPYGEPAIEPFGQRYLFGGKEREHAGGNNSYDFGARWLTSFGSWNSPDKLSESFYWLSPFSYCGGDPINYIDPDGLAWHLVDDGSDATPAFVWVDDKLAYDKDGNLKEKYYIQGIIFSPTDKEVVYSRNRTDYNIGTSIATVYKADGFTADFNACTVPSDTNKFATIPAGIYEAKVGLHKSNYKALRLGDVGTIDFYANSIELGNPNPSNPKTTKARGINIHKSGKNNYTGVIGENRGVSEGCILIDINKWKDFISIFEIQKQEGNIVGIILIR